MMYEESIEKELETWQHKMTKRPSFANKLSKKVQDRLNGFIPPKVHKIITATIKQMVRGVLFGATYTTKKELLSASLLDRETAVIRRINFYKKATATEGGITGAGGILLGIADFPIFLSMKMKMLFEIAALYGFSVKDYRERVYLLQIFSLAFSSQEHRRTVFEQIQNWDEKKESLPDDIHQFDWHHFQQEYRDYIDLVKMGQLIPGIGAVVGFIANYKLTAKLGTTAMNAYRMRLLPKKGQLPWG